MFEIALVEARSSRGVSQYRLSKETGISQPYLSRMESGERTPSIPMLVRLCKALKCQITDILKMS